ncbi:L10-interacting MYB domain-containing protein-like isoform X2 [Senna tora]|uniref:L10-interacting MYB domain-containing protein-like isoform X2 n=1 Tax=Senna tora TaxID=362788 RepID=A0A834TD81_9FABA|nr:L10-interacting MYB domain-containing protein-like isoform X2 [Senna tora]
MLFKDNFIRPLSQIRATSPPPSDLLTFLFFAAVCLCDEMEDNLRANWTPSQDQFFLELMLSHVHKGNKSGKAFSRQAWADMIEQFNAKFGFKYDVDVLKNRHKRFRKQYNEMKMLVNQSGFQWDGTLNMVIADDKTWDEHTKAHPDVQAYRTKMVPYYNELCIICGHAVADGRYSLSCFDVDFENEESASKEMDDQSPTHHTKIDWSPVMDQFFVELMLEQVRKGSKIDLTFKKKSWIDMIDAFNDRFECQYGKVVLKNRFNVLRRHYCSIQVLLGKEGFSWDKTQQKVVADDQEHHNFKLYKIKSMPFYPGMCIICRNEATSGRIANMCCKSNLEKGWSEPNAEEGKLHINGGKNSKEQALHIGGEKKSISSHQKRHQPEMAQTLNEIKKGRNSNGSMEDALKHMKVAVSSLTKKAKKEDNFSIDKVISVLQAIPEMDDDLILDACDFLEDDRRARMFLALDAKLRKKWLMRKLRPV